MTIRELDNGKNLNIQFTRFIAAWLVIFSHAYSLSIADDSVEPGKMFSGGQIYVGSISVIIFFLIGGYYISKSAERLKEAKSFFIARFKKLWPPLFAVTLVSIFVCGFISTYSLSEYYTNVQTYKYLLNACFVPVHNLPGVFENNIYESAVNGALWTMLVEAVCYIVCFIFYKLGLLSKKWFKITIIPAVLLAGAMIIFEERFAPYHVALRACLSFYIGMGIYIYRDKIKINKLAGFICLGLFILMVGIHQSDIGIYLFLPYGLLVLWYGMKQVGKTLGYLGNLSYGMYLVAFPVQQTITYFFGGSMNPYINLGLASLISIILGYIIYNLIEKRV